MNLRKKLMEIVDKYNATSYPISGSWDTETEHEMNAIADALGITLASAKALMINELGFEEDMFDGIQPFFPHDEIDDFLWEFAYETCDLEEPFDESEFVEFKDICKKNGFDVTKRDFQVYLDHVSDILGG